MKILSIGNSFSCDAQRYLHRLAKHDGVDLKTVNLYIAGCPLHKHYFNMLDDNRSYEFEFNGDKTGIFVTMRQALASDTWDVVTLQQSSNLSGKPDTYTPYIEELATYVRKYCPKAKIVIHQTWAYEADCERLKKLMIFETNRDMLNALRDAYDRAAKLINADGIIPCGEAMMKATDLGIEKIHRDTYHAALGAGRYLLALCWYKALTGADITNNDFDEFDAPVTDEQRRIVIDAVNSVISEAII